MPDNGGLHRRKNRRQVKLKIPILSSMGQHIAIVLSKIFGAKKKEKAKEGKRCGNDGPPDSIYPLW